MSAESKYMTPAELEEWERLYALDHQSREYFDGFARLMTRHRANGAKVLRSLADELEAGDMVAFAVASMDERRFFHSVLGFYYPADMDKFLPALVGVLQARAANFVAEQQRRDSAAGDPDGWPPKTPEDRNDS